MVIKYLGLLSNVDSSILKVKFKHGFKVESISYEDGIDFLHSIEGISNDSWKAQNFLFEKIFSDYRCYNSNEKKMYFIKNTIKCKKLEDNKKLLLRDSKELTYFHNNIINGYLRNTLRLMRLYNGGDIRTPRNYYYIEDELPSKSGYFTIRYVSDELFTIQEKDLQNLHEFLNETNLPFTHGYVNLALHNYEQSYETDSPILSILLSIIGLEVLFNPSDSEISHRVARNTAVLLGKDKDESEIIFNDVRNLYGKRSKLIHTGKSNNITENDLIKSRCYLRKSIKKINKINITKKELLNLLNVLGFRDKI